MRTLIVIPARAGSKGLPGKNTKLLGKIPLIAHSILFAQQITEADDVICISTNDPDVIDVANRYRLPVPFVRPDELSSDTATSYDVVMHALGFYEMKGQYFDVVLLLQPTSPFRTIDDYMSVKNAYEAGCDMVVTVTISHDNPYFNLFEEGPMGYLKKSKEGHGPRRQDCPDVFAFNGSFYLMNVNSLKKSNLSGFTKIIKSIMPQERSIDIDTHQDWKLAEYLLSQHNENSTNHPEA